MQSENKMVEGGSKRLYVGNLFPEVTSDQLKERFQRYGAVESAEVKHKTDIDGNPIQTFAFVNIVASADSISQCINAISSAKWKGYAVKVQQAKESFMSRLQKERQNKENWSQKPPTKPSDSYDPIAMFKTNLPADGENEGDEKKNIKKPVQTKVPRGIAKSSANYEKLGSGDVGKEENGVIDFSGAANKKNQPKGLKRKLQAYHSSDEEDGSDDAPVKKNKKPVMGEGYDPLALIKGKKPGDSPSKR
jgi:RNA recognition motif-containing protein